jgi:3',5'-cyclic AMP phosphodiesterase CpdA
MKDSGRKSPPGRVKAASLPPRADVRQSIAAALAKLHGPEHQGRMLSAARGPGLVHSAVKEGRPVAQAEHVALAADLLRQAQAALDAQPPDSISVAGFINNDDIALSIVLSRIAEKHTTRPAPPPGVMRQDIAGVDQYELLDPGWWASVANRLLHKKAPFLAHSSLNDFRIELPEETLSVAMVGDWGTGLASSREIARHIAALKPAITIHLGDVYYSGTKHEVETRFLPDWPAGTIGTFAINSNHEMYAGGEGYFQVTLRQSAFARHQKASYFCLSIPGWQIIGLDSAYAASDFFYQKGRLSDAQLAWLGAQLAEGARRGQRSIVLTHHNPMEVRGGTDQAFLDQMLRAGEPHPFDFWYFAHEHVAARYAPYGPEGRQFLGRCVGHGGVPYAPEGKPAAGNGVRVEWTESELAGDPEEPRRAKNGFVFLVLDSKTRKLTETFIDEFGKRKVERSF